MLLLYTAAFLNQGQNGNRILFKHLAKQPAMRFNLIQKTGSHYFFQRISQAVTDRNYVAATSLLQSQKN